MITPELVTLWENFVIVSRRLERVLESVRGVDSPLNSELEALKYQVTEGLPYFEYLAQNHDKYVQLFIQSNYDAVERLLDLATTFLNRYFETTAEGTCFIADSPFVKWLAPEIGVGKRLRRVKERYLSLNIRASQLFSTKLDLQLQLECDLWIAHISESIISAQQSRNSLLLPYGLGKLDEALAAIPIREGIKQQAMNPPFRKGLNGMLSPLNRDKGITIYRPSPSRERQEYRKLTRENPNINPITYFLQRTLQKKHPYDFLVAVVRAADDYGSTVAEAVIDEARNILEKIIKAIEMSKYALNGLPATTAAQRGHPSATNAWACRNSLRRILIRFCKDSHHAPRFQFIEGIVCMNLQALAGGLLSDVFQAKYNDADLALKLPRFFLSLSDGVKRESVYRRVAIECVLWSNLRHPNILTYLGLDVNTLQYPQTMLCLVTPWMKNGDLGNYMSTLRNDHKTVPALEWIHEISCGLRYLHDECLLHTDLRPSNILVDDEFHLRITDFGLVCLRDDIALTDFASRISTTQWLAPEVFESEASYPADVWSFGCVCLEIITGVEPFGHLRERDIFHALYVRKQLPGDPMQVDDENTSNSHDELIRVAELVLRCWNFDPGLRPDMPSVQDAIEMI